MTAKEAIGILQEWNKDLALMDDEKEGIECHEIAIKALEKQIPKKPEYIADGYADGELVYDTWVCPSCEKHYEVDYDDYDFCPNCGQAIDRRKENE